MNKTQPDLSVEIAGVKLRNPVILASGTTGRNSAMLLKAAEGGAGAVITKTVCYKGAKVGRPCIIKVPGGLLNSVEWSEMDYEVWIDREIPAAKKGGVPLIASVSSVKSDPTEIANLAKSFADAGVDMVEIATAYSVEHLANFIHAVKEVTDIPVIAKMVFTTFDLKNVGIKCAEAGADAISCMDTVGPGLKLNIETGEPVLGRLTGACRLSGAAIKPISTYFVSELARAVDIPIIGIGGVMNGDDAVETMMAGARAVEVCTATILNGHKALGDIANGIASYMSRKGYGKVDDFIGLGLKKLDERKQRGIVRYEGKPPVINSETCTGCGACVKSCPYYALSIPEGVAVVDVQKCYGCGLCTTICPVHAMKLQY